MLRPNPSPSCYIRNPPPLAVSLSHPRAHLAARLPGAWSSLRMAPVLSKRLFSVVLLSLGTSNQLRWASGCCTTPGCFLWSCPQLCHHTLSSSTPLSGPSVSSQDAEGYRGVRASDSPSQRTHHNYPQSVRGELKGSHWGIWTPWPDISTQQDPVVTSLHPLLLLNSENQNGTCIRRPVALQRCSWTPCQATSDGWLNLALRSVGKHVGNILC